MRNFVLLLILSSFASVLPTLAPAQTCEAFDPEHHNSPVCEQGSMFTMQADEGYVTARGQWIPVGEITPKESIVEITCVNTPVQQLADSKLGFCLMAAAYLGFAESRNIGISTNSYGIVSWGKSRIIAERDESWQSINCEQQQLVLDFPSNAVTITSTLSMTPERCAKMNRGNKKETAVFALKHYPLEMFPSKETNPFLQEKGK